ncbi:hypothetical protein CIW69_07045 [Enterobacter cloacae]|nr:hypothetical protein CIW69_07045 [Enterobacter cloacae]
MRLSGYEQKKAHSGVGKKYWKQCEQCRTEYLSISLNYSVLRKIIFLNKRCNPTFHVARSVRWLIVTHSLVVMLITNFLSQILCYSFLCS